MFEDLSLIVTIMRIRSSKIVSNQTYDSVHIHMWATEGFQHCSGDDLFVFFPSIPGIYPEMSISLDRGTPVFFHHNDNQHQRWTKLKKWPIVQVVSVWFNLKVWQGMTTKIPHFYILSSDLPWTKPSVSIGGSAFLKVWPRWTIWLWLPWILGSGDTLQGWPWRFSMFFWHKNGHAINGNVTFNS